VSGSTKIQWTEMTWNPVTGCSKVSAGCANCYAARMARRLRAMGQKRYAKGFEVVCHEEVLEEPLRWKKPRRVFVNSMSDLFHEKVPMEFLVRIFSVMNRCPQHQFQVLTKRSGRLAEVAGKLTWTKNIWMGVTVENQDNVFRIADLQRVPAGIRFLSCEPLIGPIEDLPLEGIHWVIVGGESGPGARIVKEEWIEGIRLKCERMKVPFFFKQWSGQNVHRKGHLLRGKAYREYPNIENVECPMLNFE
jgi:protein gp37